MKLFDYYRYGENVYAGGRQYKAGELLVSYMNLNIERLDTLYSACLAQKNSLMRFERSEEYSKVLHRSVDTFDVVDKLFSKLSPYSRVEGENITLLSIMEKSPLFRGFDVISSDSVQVQSWRNECEKLGDMYLSALDALRFCRDIAAPFLTALEESGSEEKAFEAISSDSIPMAGSNEKLALAQVNGEKKMCMYTESGNILSFVHAVFRATLTSEVRPRPCGCCGKFFLPANRLAKFCERKAPDGSGKLCREVGARRKYEKKQKGNPISAAYTRVYKARYARMTNGKLTKDEMNEWTAKAAELRESALAGNIPCEDFEQMLKNL